MIACDVEQHREIVDWMARTLAACRASERFGMFTMEKVRHSCGSPACLGGHGVLELPEALAKGRKNGRKALVACREYMGFPIIGNASFDDLGGPTKKRMLWAVGAWWFSGHLSTAEAFRRWTLTLNYRRRQLAQLEVDAGEWGRPKPARDMPVGQERERQVLVLELVGGAA